MEKKNNKKRIIVYSILLFILIVLSAIGIGSKYMGYGHVVKNNEFLTSLENTFNSSNATDGVEFKTSENSVVLTFNEEIYEFIYENDILSTRYPSNNINSINMSKIILDLISMNKGYNYGESFVVYSNMPTKDVTLDYGFEYIFNEKETIFKVNTTHAITDIPITNDAIYAIDLINHKEQILNGNFQLEKNNIISGTLSVSDNIKTIIIKEIPGLSNATYNTMVGYINTMYDEKIISYFNQNYTELKKNNFEIQGLKIEYCPKPTNQEKGLLGEDVYEFVRVTIDTSKIK